MVNEALVSDELWRIIQSLLPPDPPEEKCGRLRVPIRSRLGATGGKPACDGGFTAPSWERTEHQTAGRRKTPVLPSSGQSLLTSVEVARP